MIDLELIKFSQKIFRRIFLLNNKNGTLSIAHIIFFCIALIASIVSTLVMALISAGIFSNDAWLLNISHVMFLFPLLYYPVVVISKVIDKIIGIILLVCELMGLGFFLLLGIGMSPACRAYVFIDMSVSQPRISEIAGFDFPNVLLSNFEVDREHCTGDDCAGYAMMKFVEVIPQSFIENIEKHVKIGTEVLEECSEGAVIVRTWSKESPSIYHLNYIEEELHLDFYIYIKENMAKIYMQKW